MCIITSCNRFLLENLYITAVQDDLIASMYSECIQALLSASEKVVLILRAENKTDSFAWLNM